MASLQLLPFFRNGDKIVSYLLYCILSGLKTQSPVALVGVDGRPVFLLSNDGLSAAVSEIQHPHISYNIPWLLAYKQVIEAFHNDLAIGGVIPMRYGCLFEEISQVIKILKKSRVEYISLLKELEGCVEMGIRILISPASLQYIENSRSSDGRADIDRQQKQENIASRQGEHKSQIANCKPKIPTSGRAYLAALKAYYAQEERLNKQVEQVTERCCGAFNGLFKKYKTEFPSNANFQSVIRNPLPSIYFLVPRDCQDRFREVYRHVAIRESPSLLLSGPWPPYNFAQPEYNDRNESMIGGIE